MADRKGVQEINDETMSRPFIAFAVNEEYKRRSIHSGGGRR